MGEKAITTTNQYLQGKRRSTNTQQQNGVGPSTQTSAATGAEDEESSDEDVG